MSGEKPVDDARASAVAAGTQRYVPVPPARNLEDFGGGKREKLSSAAVDADLIPDYKAVLSQEELLNTADAMKLYNEGMTAEIFMTTVVGRKLARQAQEDQAAFQALALKTVDLHDHRLTVAHKRALAAEYFFEWLTETLAKAEQATQTLRIQDDQELEG